eukprot:s907_g18.t4
MEYSSGSAWINGHKVCSATAGKMPGTEDVGPGWVDIATVTRVLHLDRAEVEKDAEHWQQQLGEHFRSIFAKPQPTQNSNRVAELRRQLRLKCKNTAWTPFTAEELLYTSATWANNKSTGPDGISHEAAKALLEYNIWKDRLLYPLAKIPEGVDKGITALLPKIPVPLVWGDTRPITLSSTQLLLLRGEISYEQKPSCNGPGKDDRGLNSLPQSAELFVEEEAPASGEYIRLTASQTRKMVTQLMECAYYSLQSDVACCAYTWEASSAAVEEDKNPGEKDSAQDTAADERDARTPLGDTNPTGDTSTDKTDYDLRGKDSGNAPTKEELPDWSDPAGDVAPVTPPSSPYEATGAGEAAPVTPSLLKDDETVDVGLKQLWPTQAAWLWPTQAAWNVVFQCCDDEVPARRVGSAATGGAPDTAPAEDDGRPRAFQPGEDHVLAYLPDADDLEVLVEEEPLPTTNGTAAQAGEQRAAEIRRRRAEEQRRQGR